ncbi:hypothetical protein QNI19_25400 [Cytophagaceae bacterium DM2B3-1]|uniref:Uncharacterized protein n=1 Tax=Xanthocytophaga flava TaxID=3048013 RepID=A0ABT7CUJ3_9BACT|nr:hypothetical protein [Xanthocytophaga flavus]MDJ1496299.1 hypothetical protein [Xanthocytophaga flavus]
MLNKFLFSILFCIVLPSCHTSTEHDESQKDITHKKEPKPQYLPDKKVESVSDSVKPVFGYRFHIQGDFNGDGHKEVLTEHFINGITHQETNKFYEGLKEYDQLVALTIQKNPESFFTCSDPRIDTLAIASGGQLLGVAFARNEGDLNQDGTDELSYVVNWADWSNINTYVIMTYQNGKWEELYTFGIWDWQLPDLPEVNNHYGHFGLMDKEIDVSHDTVYQNAEQKLKHFKGFIIQRRKGKIRIIQQNQEAELDTIWVDLNRTSTKVDNTSQ